jgi:hypothetical protein
MYSRRAFVWVVLGCFTASSLLIFTTRGERAAQDEPRILIPVEPFRVEKRIEAQDACNCRFFNQWAYDKVGIPPGAQAIGVDIAIVDTGANPVEDLGASVVDHWNFVANNSDVTDTNGHGTGVLGNIAGYLGYLAKARVHVYKADVPDAQGRQRA